MHTYDGPRSGDIFFLIAFFLFLLLGLNLTHFFYLEKEFSVVHVKAGLGGGRTWCMAGTGLGV